MEIRNLPAHYNISEVDLTGPAINFEVLRSVTGGDIEFEKELFGLFIQTATSSIKKIEQSITDDDPNSWRESFHLLKGSSFSVGAFVMSKICDYGQSHQRDSLESKNKIFNDFKNEFEKVSKFIDEFIKK